MTRAALDAALLTPSDLGTQFKLGQYGAAHSAGPCAAPGTPSISSQVPPQLTDGRTLTTAIGDAGFVQTVNVYADASEADRAFGLLTKEASCSAGHLPPARRSRSPRRST